MLNLTEILTGFGSVAVLILVGWLFGRSEIVDKKASFTLNMVVFWIAMPCMLAHTLATADAGAVFGAPFAVAAVSALATAVLYRIVAAPPLHQRGADAMVGAMSSSYNNVANLGIPIAVAVLHDATAVVPALIFQIAFYAPLSMIILEVLTRRGRFSIRATLTAPLKNPIFLAAMVGLFVNATGVSIPEVVTKPVGLLGQAAVPMALLAFGISLHGMPFMEAGRSPRRAVVVASLMKLVVHPALALLVGWAAFGLSGKALLAAVVIAGLPTAQNVYTFSTRFGCNLEQARDCGVVTTLACLPTIFLFTLALT
ncbi:AEC family transporter [Corynebacterium lactis]|uniref:Membrane protein n=1 Tax=Corynebacterium lactis RW2-5 TaxID=1408189 RepID=A0A0K2H1U1_9CORY|nr:AEC family transporter [Corynebacterium lactis]ALA67903.1 membrane protein [Corynebacterium lactis RW2-5]